MRAREMRAPLGGPGAGRALARQAGRGSAEQGALLLGLGDQVVGVGPEQEPCGHGLVGGVAERLEVGVRITVQFDQRGLVEGDRRAEQDADVAVDDQLLEPRPARRLPGRGRDRHVDERGPDAAERDAVPVASDHHLAVAAGPVAILELDARRLGRRLAPGGPADAQIQAALELAFASAGIGLDRPVVTTCGSGVTAAVLLFAMHLLGKEDVALYDGSWSEWGADPATPKATGPAA